VGLLNVALWLGGVALMMYGVTHARGPYSRYRALHETNENIRRYEQWRGGRRDDAGAVTGADVMRAELRRQLRIWGLVIAAGFALVFLGFAVGT
jgi:hypothetical protein